MRSLLAVAFVLGFVFLASADDKKADPTGTWKFSVDRNGQTIDFTFKFKVEGEKLTGTMSVMDMETKIEDGKSKDGAISFKVVPEFNGDKIEMKFSGKVMGDTLKGKREREVNGKTNSREFEAKRVKD